jgi:hypothetical protein
LSGDSAKTEIARAYGRKKLGFQAGRGSLEGLAEKRVYPVVLRRRTQVLVPGKPGTFAVLGARGCMLMKNKYLLGVAVAKPNRRCL